MATAANGSDNGGREHGPLRRNVPNLCLLIVSNLYGSVQPPPLPVDPTQDQVVIS